MCGLMQAAESAFSNLLKLKTHFLCCETQHFADAAEPQLLSGASHWATHNEASKLHSHAHDYAPMLTHF